MPRKAWEDRDGDTSSMRVAMLMAVGTGCALGIAGGVAMFLRIPEAVPMASVGAGIILGAQGWKYAQARVEAAPTVEVRGPE